MVSVHITFVTFEDLVLQFFVSPTHVANLKVKEKLHTGQS